MENSRFADIYIIWFEVIVWISVALQIVASIVLFNKNSASSGVNALIAAVSIAVAGMGVKALFVLLIQIRDK